MLVMVSESFGDLRPLLPLLCSNAVKIDHTDKVIKFFDPNVMVLSVFHCTKLFVLMPRAGPLNWATLTPKLITLGQRVQNVQIGWPTLSEWTHPKSPPQEVL